MKIHGVVLLTAAIAIAQSALAELPLKNDGLGQTEALLDYCSKVESKSADKYKEEKKKVAGNASEKELEDARASDEYKQSYGEVTAFMNKATKQDAITFCSSMLKSK